MKTNKALKTIILIFMALSLFSQTETKLVAIDDILQDIYGESISISGDRIVVSAWNGNQPDEDDSGSAYIYQWDGNNWIETRLSASDGDIRDFYGKSVSISGDRIIVSAGGDDDNGNNSGSVYLYEWDGMNWQETKLLASDGKAGDGFGGIVSIDGDRAIVNGAGAVYIYEWDGMNWQETKLAASDGEPAGFGARVSIDGNRAIVGTVDNSAYIYEWDGTIWQETKLAPNDLHFTSDFGLAVEINENRAIIGDPAENSAYIYQWDGMEWQEAKLEPSDGFGYERFGHSVSISGNRAIISASKDNDNGDDSGSAYIYEFDGIDWIETKLLASDGLANDKYGASVSIDNERAIVSATGNSLIDIRGAVYVYELDNSTSFQEAKHTLVNLYPNPTQDKLKIESDLKSTTYQIFNIQGQLRASGAIPNHEINLSELEPGTYVMRIFIEGDRIILEKILKI